MKEVILVLLCLVSLRAAASFYDEYQKRQSQLMRLVPDEGCLPDSERYYSYHFKKMDPEYIGSDGLPMFEVKFSGQPYQGYEVPGSCQPRDSQDFAQSWTKTQILQALQRAGEIPD